MWQICFEDEEDAPRACLSLPEVTLCTLREQGRTVAMAVSIPVTLSEQSGRYLYAVCVAPEQRGKGYFRTLMRQCEAQAADLGASFLCLVPADEALAETYRRMGYGTEVALWEDADEKAEKILPAGEGFCRLAKDWYETEHVSRYGLLKWLSTPQKNRKLAFACPMGEV